MGFVQTKAFLQTLYNRTRLFTKKLDEGKSIDVVFRYTVIHE